MGWLGACAAALACSGGSDDTSATPPFGGTATDPNAMGAASNATNPGGAGSTPAGIQGTPEQIGGLPRTPGGSAVPVENGVNGRPPTNGAPATLENVLVFTRTLGYRHEAIGVGIQAIVTLGAQNGFAVESTEDPTLFTDAGLADFDVVVWLSTTMDVLDDTQQAAFERFIRAGGGWVGVHAAADTEYTWPWYGQLLGNGAYFKSHPAVQTANVNVADATHASTANLPASFQVEDELYNYQVNPRSAVTVLLTLDEGSYMPGVDAMGADHPIAWFHEFEGGRAWYTGLGHQSALYQNPLFTQHLLGGIRWAAGVAP